MLTTPLPSWYNTITRQTILDFAAIYTPKYILPAERIATLDFLAVKKLFWKNQ